MHPLRFEPLLKSYLWGGRRLAQFGKRLGDDPHYAESWEICDHDQDQSVVLAGELAGKTLGELVRDRGRELLGRHHPQTRFPLLFKFLDAQQRLSVQVHPNDNQAARLRPPDFGKTEAWVVLGAEPGAPLYVGFKPGFDRRAVERELHRGTLELCLHRFEPKAGDCVFLPAGVVHAIGGGLLIAEIQQSSDVTYRLFDWNRVGPDGQPRTLHVEQALACINFDYGPGRPLQPRRADSGNVSAKDVERLVECDKFILDRRRLTGPVSLGGDDRCHILAVIEGAAVVAGDPLKAPLMRGGTCLLPAGCGATRITPVGEAIILDAYLP